MDKETLETIVKNVIKNMKNASSATQWDDYVPIISEKDTHYVYLVEQFNDPSNYNKLCHMLLTASEYETFILMINSPGGILDSAFMIVDAIRFSKAKVKCRLTGTVASAATIVVMACEDIIVSPNLAFMVHNYSSGIQGKGHEMRARQTFIDDQLAKAFESYYLGFLTEDEIKDVIEGKDLWMGDEEVIQRWKNKKKFSKSSQEGVS